MKKNLTNNTQETNVVAANTNNNMSKEDNNNMKNTTINSTGAHFYNGNVKVGDMLTFNKLAGCSVINGCKGTCGHHCCGCWNADDWKKSPCYVAKSYSQYKDTVINSHIVNTVAIREHIKETFEELNAQLHRKRTLKTVRWHSSGELETALELRYHLWMAKENPGRVFYIYTKAYELVDEVLQELEDKGEQLPENYFLNVSIWHQFGIDCYHKWEHFRNVRAFVYDDGEFDYAAAGLRIVCYCPAYKKSDKGKVYLSHELTCDNCKICFQEKAKVAACLSH